MCPLELSDTPATSPKYRSAGSFRKSGNRAIRDFRHARLLSNRRASQGEKQKQDAESHEPPGNAKKPSRSYQDSETVRSLRDGEHEDRAIRIGDGNCVTLFLHFESTFTQFTRCLFDIRDREYNPRFRIWRIGLEFHFVARVAGHIHLVSVCLALLNAELLGIISTLRHSGLSLA